MDRVKGIAKGGWQPSGDRQIHRETWKSDLKNMASGKKQDPYASARNHQSAPLSSLKDPDSFGAPPRHKDKDNYEVPDRSTFAYSATKSTPGTTTLARASNKPKLTGGWGSVVPSPRDQEAQQQEEEEEEAQAPPEPYRKDTTGLRTDNLPKPPSRRVPDGETAAAAAAAPPPPMPPRGGQASMPALPPRRQTPTQAPPPGLPPRMNDHPDEHTPPAPPPYHEVARSAASAISPAVASRAGRAAGGYVSGLSNTNNGSSAASNSSPATINTAAASRLGQAGISVSGFGIGNSAAQNSAQEPSAPSGHASQLSELQQRFARMGSGSVNGSTANSTAAMPAFSSAATTIAAQKKAPPPPPPKKAGLTAEHGSSEPPPLPLASKPRPS